MSAAEREITRAETQRRRGWEEKKLYGCFYESTAKNSALSFTRAMQFNYGRIVDKNESFETDEVKDIYAKYSLVKKGDIVINGLNLNYDVVSQRVAIVPKDGIITSAYIVLRPRPGTFSEYFCYLFKAMDSRKIFHGMGTGIRLTLSFRELKNMPIPLPPLPEQKEIVAYLDAETGRIDKAIAAEEKMIALLQERREIVINEAVGGGEDFNADAQRDRVRRGWEVKRLKSELLANDGGVWGDDPRGNERDTIVLRSTEQNVDGTLSVLEPAIRNLSEFERSKAWLQEGDLIVTKSSGSQEHIGKTSIIDKTIADKGCCYSNFLQRLRVRGNPKYFWYLLNGAIAKRQIERMATTTTGLKNLTGKILGNLEFPLPPLPEQEAIVERLDRETGKIDRAIEVKRRQIELLRERRQIVIDEAVTGKVKVA